MQMMRMSNAADFVIGLIVGLLGTVVVGALVVAIGYVFVLVIQWVGPNSIICIAVAAWMLYCLRHEIIFLGRSVRERFGKDKNEEVIHGNEGAWG
jgi:fatty acid desaturase